MAPIAALAATALGLGCGPTGGGGIPAPVDIVHDSEPVPNPLGVYRRLGYILGDRRFPVVGNFVFLPGPGDSSYVVLALSLPNTALKFRRAPVGFLARYQVDVVVGDSAAPRARLSKTEDVYVRTFRETSRGEESVVFQGFLKLMPGLYPVVVHVRDLASGAKLTEETNVQVPRFDPPFVTAPVIVYRAKPRPSRATPPTIILNPRATVAVGISESQVYVEGSAPSGFALIQARTDGQVISTDTLTLLPESDQLSSAIWPLESWQFPPGRLELRTGLNEPEAATSTSLVVALTPDWVVSDYQEALSYLRYAGKPSQLDSLLTVGPGERARLLQSLWDERDPVPATAENEFFERYFRRIAEANDRFSEPGTAGWLTDRGAVYITFGPPDEVLRHLDPGQGAQQSQVWVYNESLGFEVRLVFVDTTGTSAYRLTVESRRDFLEAVQTHYS